MRVTSRTASSPTRFRRSKASTSRGDSLPRRRWAATSTTRSSWRKNERTGLLIGDASGHGLPAALLVRDVVTGLRMAAYWDFRIERIMGHLNSVIHKSRLTTRFVSLFYGEVERSGNFFYVNCGHPPPLLVNPTRGIQHLDMGGSILGPLPEQRFKRGFAHIDRGGLLVLYTDGLSEREAGGKMFGEGPLEEYVLSHREDSAEDLCAGRRRGGEGLRGQDSVLRRRGGDGGAAERLTGPFGGGIAGRIRFNVESDVSDNLRGKDIPHAPHVSRDRPAARSLSRGFSPLGSTRPCTVPRLDGSARRRVGNPVPFGR